MSCAKAETAPKHNNARRKNTSFEHFMDENVRGTALSIK
jgi:hypothetical protein